jgi:small conductance mechanosensitive channel
MEYLTSNLITSLMIIILTVILILFLQIIARRSYKYIGSLEDIRKERRQQTITFLQIITWIITVTAVCVASLMILSDFGVDITPLLASVGIAGLAFSLGAQTLIKDFIGGFLILFENQFVIGDTIQLDGLTGTVERITLRATNLRDGRGFQYTIPNGEIRIVANANKEWAHALVDLNLAYGEDVERVTRVLAEVANSICEDSDFKQAIKGSPEVVGPIVHENWSIVMRVMVKIKPDRRIEITRELQKRVLQACAQEGISLSHPPQDVWAHGKVI